MSLFKEFLGISIFLFLISWICAQNANSGSKDLERLRQKWEECCRNNENMCSKGSCYSVEWRTAAWATVRNRCRSRYSEWPFAVDVLSVTDESDIEKMWTVLTRAKAYTHSHSAFPTTVWTSGTRCPRRGPTGLVVSTRWTSDQPFPTWLEEKINKTSNVSKDQEDTEGCKFLVISPNSNISEVEYSFQDQNAKHAAICQFLFPGEIEWEESTKTSHIVTLPSTAALTESVTMSPKLITKDRKTQSSVDGRWIHISTNPAETSSERFPTANIKSTRGSSIYDDETSSTFSTSTTPITSTSWAGTASNFRVTDPHFIGCKGKEFAGIHWPDTPLGVTVNKSCPQGMIGFAQWTCDERTRRFTPALPYVQDCRHEWLDKIKCEIDSGGDALKISKKLENETKSKPMSHGDISALVSLTEKLFDLFKKQRKPLVTSTQNKSPPAYNFTKSIVSTFSYVLRTEEESIWDSLPQIYKRREASKILQQVTSVGHHLGCSRISRQDLQYTLIEENINLQTFVLLHEQRNKSLIFPERVEGIISNSKLALPTDMSFDQWLSQCGKVKTAVGAIYKNVGEFLRDETSETSHMKVWSPIVSFSMVDSTAVLPMPTGQMVSIVLEHNERIQVQYIKDIKCVFWNFNKDMYGQWDDEGCQVVYSNSTHTECSCNHLTNFAVIMDVSNNIDSNDEVLELMTFICCGTSTIALLITFMCLLGIKSLHCRRSTITCNLCLCLLVMNALIMFGLNQTKIKMLCASLAGVLHFSILAAFCWMLLEGYQLYQMVILVFNSSSQIRLAYLYGFGYGVPLLVVAVSAGVRYYDYGGPDFCWLTNTNGLIWSFVGPACVIILINFIIFIMTIKSASSVRIKKEQNLVQSTKAWLKGSMSVLCLLGLTWSVGLLYIFKKLYATSYIFTALNGLQGVFIFIFHVLLNEKASAFIIKAFQKQFKLEKPRMQTQTTNNGMKKRNSGTSTTSRITVVDQSNSRSSAFSNCSSSQPNKTNLYDKTSKSKIRRLSSPTNVTNVNGNKNTSMYSRNVNFRNVQHKKFSRSISQYSLSDDNNPTEIYQNNDVNCYNDADTEVNKIQVGYRLPRLYEQ